MRHKPSSLLLLALRVASSAAHRAAAPDLAWECTPQHAEVLCWWQAYIESSTGIKEGARTGIAALTVTFCFFLSLFFNPLLGAQSRPACAACCIASTGCLAGWLHLTRVPAGPSDNKSMGLLPCGAWALKLHADT